MKNSTQSTTPLLSPTIKLALNIYFCCMRKRNHHDQTQPAFRESYANFAEINLLLAQESRIINDSSTKSHNSYLIVDLSCTSTCNIFLYTLLIIYLFYIQSTSYYFNYTCTNSQLSLFNSLFLDQNQQKIVLVCWRYKKFVEQLFNKQK